MTLDERLRATHLVVLDVDGTLTDGGIHYAESGELFKIFDVKDGMGLVALRKSGIALGIITGRHSEIVAARAADLGMDAEMVILGSRDKRTDIEALAARAGVPLEQTAAMGDDLPDLPMLDAAGLSCCPADAVPELLDRCAWVSKRPGGRGAVRELAEAVLKAQGRWQQVVDLFS